MPTPTDPKSFLIALFQAAIASAQPALRIQSFLPQPPNGRTIVIGAGKASAAMAQALEQAWPGPLEGLVVTRYGYAQPCQHIEIVEAAHPVPDHAGERAAQRMLSYVADLTEQDLVICLISGGGSSLLPLPMAGLSLQDKQDINKALLRSGASIGEMNCVRRHLSQIKGGRLAAACHPARVVNLLISDVPGDNPMDIASGPTVADPTTCEDALRIVDRYRISLPPAARSILESGRGESVKPSDQRLQGIETHLIATPRMALQAAAHLAESQGVRAYILGDAFEGEAKDVGRVLAALTQEQMRSDGFLQRPCVLLSGGETTVTVRGEGRGGRNVECLLSMALQLKGQQGVYALAGDTDGVDGMEEIAGAVIGPDTLLRAWNAGLIPQNYLDHNDAHSLFELLGDQVTTGPTLTNVNDFRAIYLEPLQPL